MARKARIVIPEFSHHVSQKGRKVKGLFRDKDDANTYLDILRDTCEQFRLHVWAYCLLQNEIHFVCVPVEEQSLAKAVGETHRQYTKYYHSKYKTSGSLWYDRFQSYVLGETYLQDAISYVEGLPVLKGLASSPDEFIWSSARAHIGKAEPHNVLKDDIAKNLIGDWERLFEGFQTSHSNDNGRSDTGFKSEVFEKIEAHLSTGRPLGDDHFIDMMEAIVGRRIRPKKRGRKPKSQS